MGPFNNREIAGAFWLFVLAVFVLRKQEVRRSIGSLVRAFCHLKILVLVGVMLLYTTAMVVLLRALGVWKATLLKDTIVWFWLGAVAMKVRFMATRNTEDIFRKVVTDNVKIVILLEFLSNAYTFSLPVELIILPILGYIAVIDAVASSYEKFSRMARYTKGLVATIGVVLLGIGVGQAISGFQSLRSWDTARSIVLAPLLSVLLVPFLYAAVLYSKYESVFLRLNLGIEKEKGLKRYAKRRIVRYSRLSLKRLQQLLRDHPADLMQIRTESDVDRLLRTDTES